MGVLFFQPTKTTFCAYDGKNTDDDDNNPFPNFLVLFFHQVIVPKKVIFYPKLTIFVGFLVIFVIIIIKITKILIKIIMATIIIIISIFFPSYAQNVVFVGRIKSVKLPDPC